MLTTPPASLIEHLRKTVLGDGAGLGDGELLDSFIERHDEAALAALIKRHGPMVWAVCRRHLSHHDAEDAFQATFLVLVRKAASIVPREMVGNWLYGVAYRTALQARRTAARRKAREAQLKEMPDPAVCDQGFSRDLPHLLDEELSRLPDKSRAVIVLCELEGKTRKEVAGQLGVPEGTVAGWLARARKMLGKRLAHRGITLSGASLAAVLTERAASASVPSSVLSSTLSVAKAFAAGHAATAGTISPTVAALSEGVLKTMLVSKLRLGVLVLALFSVLGVGVMGVRSMQPVAKSDPSPAGIEPGQKENPNQPPDKASAKGLRETLLGLEKAGWDALKGKKRDQASATMADDFMAIMADGGRLNRADFLKLLADMTLTDYSLADVALTRLTPDAAVLTYKAETDYTYKGEAIKETIWVSSAWARRDGQWMNVLYHETRVAK